MNGLIYDGAYKYTSERREKVGGETTNFNYKKGVGKTGGIYWELDWVVRNRTSCYNKGDQNSLAKSYFTKSFYRLH